MLLSLKSEDCHHHSNQTFILLLPFLQRIPNTKKPSRQPRNPRPGAPLIKKEPYGRKRERHTQFIPKIPGGFFLLSGPGFAQEPREAPGSSHHPLVTCYCSRKISLFSCDSNPGNKSMMTPFHAFVNFVAS